jgi:hypothetical protein
MYNFREEEELLGDNFCEEDEIIYLILWNFFLDNFREEDEIIYLILEFFFG